MPVRLGPQLASTFSVSPFGRRPRCYNALFEQERFLMDEQDSEGRDASPAESSGEISSPSGTEGQQQKFQLTPEQRRFLGGARSMHHQSTADSKLAKSPPASKPNAAAPDAPRLSEQKPS